MGDRYVLEMMQREGMNLGGEQSGHIIFLDEMPTGDGQLAALHILQILCQEQKPISQLIAAIPRYPQVLLGAKASLYPEERKAVMQAPRLQEAIAAAEAKLGSEGRILIPSLRHGGPDSRHGGGPGRRAGAGNRRRAAGHCSRFTNVKPKFYIFRRIRGNALDIVLRKAYNAQ